MIPRLTAQLTTEEGLRLRPYHDTVGKLTIGVGRNLDDVGIFPDEAALMLSNDIKRTVEWLNNFDWFKGLDEVRQAVIVDMTFNIGQGGLLHFPKMLHMVEISNWDAAATEMENSKWHAQVGSRALRLESMMRNGTWAEDINYGGA